MDINLDSKILVVSGSGCPISAEGYSEALISEKTGKDVHTALKHIGYKNVDFLSLCRDTANPFIQTIKEINPDVIFNATHGTWGEDGLIQMIFDDLDIPYTHSKANASRLGFHKKIAKLMMPHLPIIADIRINHEELISGNYKEKLSTLKGEKFVLKPSRDGSSMHISVLNLNNLPDFSNITKSHDDFIIEQYAPGREITVGIFNDKPFGIMEITYSDEIFSYHTKYHDDTTRHVIPNLKPDIQQKLLDYALQAHKAIGCDMISRSDFKLDDEGNIYFIEINTHPGLTDKSLIPDIAKNNNMTYNTLVENILKSATKGNIKWLPKDSPFESYRLLNDAIFESLCQAISAQKK